MAIVVAFNVAFLAYVVFLMVFSFWPHVLWKLVFMGSLAFRLPFASVCRFPARFHSGYYSSGNFLSVLLLSCFLSVHSFQVSFLVCVIFKLVSLACVTFRLFSRSVALQLAVSGMCHFHSSFMVIFLFCSPFSFMAFVAYRFFSWCLPPSS